MLYYNHVTTNKMKDTVDFRHKTKDGKQLMSLWAYVSQLSFALCYVTAESSWESKFVMPELLRFLWGYCFHKA